MIKKLIIPAAIGVFTLSLYACKGGGSTNPSKFTGKWQATSFVTPTNDSILDSQMKSMLAQIDGLTEVDKNMEEQFKTKNVDSVKVKWRAMLNEQKAKMEEEKKKEVENFKIDIKADGYVIKQSAEKNDSAAWYTTNAMGKELLFMDPSLINKPGEMLSFVVDEVSGDKMTLSLHGSAGMKVLINLKKVK